MTAFENAHVRRVLITLSCAAFASQSLMRVADPMLPALGAEFGTTATEASIVVTAFTIGYGLLQLVWGPLADRLGKLRLIALASLGAAVSAALCAAAPSLALLGLLRGLSGAFCAGLIPLSMAWIGDQVPYERRQHVLAQFMAGSTSGLLLGQATGGLFAGSLGWRGAFGVLAATMLGAAALLARQRRVMRRDGISEVLAPPAPGTLTSTLSPFAKILADPWARRVLGIVFVEGALVFAAMAFVPTYLHQAHGMPLWLTGIVVAGYGGGGLLYATLARWLIPRLGERGLSLLGGFLLCLGLTTIGSGDPWVECVKTLAAGTGFFMLHGTLQTLATQMAPAIRGSAIAAFAFCLFAGQTAGISLAALIAQQTGFRSIFVVAGLAVGTLAVIVYRAIAARSSVSRSSR